MKVFDTKGRLLTKATGVGDFSDGGEAGGADRTLGNTDNYDLGFLTNNSNRLHIQNDGKVGIETTNPQAKLDIAGKIFFNETANISVPALATTAFALGGDFSFISYYPNFGFNAIWNTTSNQWEYMQSDGAFTLTHIRPSDQLVFRYAASGIAGNAITWSTGMVIDGTGKIGLSTTSPSTRLDIADGAIEFEEMTAPAAGAANTARLFCRDNGAGKSQLCVRFNTGAIQVLATEP